MAVTYLGCVFGRRDCDLGYKGLLLTLLREVVLMRLLRSFWLFMRESDVEGLENF